jgi:hypothetical protein
MGNVGGKDQGHRHYALRAAKRFQRVVDRGILMDSQIVTKHAPTTLVLRTFYGSRNRYAGTTDAQLMQ